MSAQTRSTPEIGLILRHCPSLSSVKMISAEHWVGHSKRIRFSSSFPLKDYECCCRRRSRLISTRRLPAKRFRPHTNHIYMPCLFRLLRPTILPAITSQLRALLRSPPPTPIHPA